MRQELLKGGADSLSLGLKNHGRAYAPYSCTIRILQGSTVLESGMATAGVYAPTVAVTAECAQDLTAEWSYVETVGAAARKKVELFDVVLFKLYPVVTDDDILSEAASLMSSDYVHHGEVSGTPSTTTLVDQSLIGSFQDYVGSILTFLTGTKANSQYVITSFVSATGTLGATFGTAAVAAETFMLRRSFQGEIDQAWEDIYDKLIQDCSSDAYSLLPNGLANNYASRPFLVMTPDRLRRPHLCKALEKIYRGIANDQNGVDWARAEHYKAEFESIWKGMRLVFAYGGDTTTPTASKEVTGQWGFNR